MKYAQLDSHGKPVGFYDSAIHKEIPSGCTQITDEQWEMHISNPGKYIIHNGKMVDAPAHVLTIEEHRQSVLNKWETQINEQREILRKMIDEAKPPAAIDKTRANLKSMIASKNTELAGVQ